MSDVSRRDGMPSCSICKMARRRIAVGARRFVDRRQSEVLNTIPNLGVSGASVGIGALLRCRIPDDHMVACETDAGVSDTTLSSPASAYCS